MRPDNPLRALRGGEGRVRGGAAFADAAERAGRAEAPLTLPSPHYVGRG